MLAHCSAGRETRCEQLPHSWAVQDNQGQLKTATPDGVCGHLLQGQARLR
jgi:hypothetical protein